MCVTRAQRDPQFTAVDMDRRLPASFRSLSVLWVPVGLSPSSSCKENEGCCKSFPPYRIASSSSSALQRAGLAQTYGSFDSFRDSGWEMDIQGWEKRKSLLVNQTNRALTRRRENFRKIFCSCQCNGTCLAVTVQTWGRGG